MGMDICSCFLEGSRDNRAGGGVYDSYIYRDRRALPFRQRYALRDIPFLGADNTGLVVDRVSDGWAEINFYFMDCTSLKLTYLKEFDRRNKSAWLNAYPDASFEVITSTSYLGFVL